MKVQASISNPPAFCERFDERVNGPDKGLLNAWLAGLERSKDWPDVAERARNGELPLLPYLGGVEKKLKTKGKIGSLHYLAMWHGLRGEDLNIDMDGEPVVVCQRTGVPVTFTMDIQKLAGI